MTHDEWAKNLKTRVLWSDLALHKAAFKAACDRLAVLGGTLPDEVERFYLGKAAKSLKKDGVGLYREPL